MADTPVHMIVNLSEITDPATYRTYEKGFFPLLKKHGGEFVTFDDKAETLEGEETLEGRVIIFRFPSEDAARAWYADPAYQELSKHRRAGTKLKFLTLVRGMPTR
ncbi:MAG: DUF1330 domain-containing protein [Candidatus Phaeomarinobacter sp.]